MRSVLKVVWNKIQEGETRAPENMENQSLRVTYFCAENNFSTFGNTMPLLTFFCCFFPLSRSLNLLACWLLALLQLINVNYYAKEIIKFSKHLRLSQKSKISWVETLFLLFSLWLDWHSIKKYVCFSVKFTTRSKRIKIFFGFFSIRISRPTQRNNVTIRSREHLFII